MRTCRFNRSYPRVVFASLLILAGFVFVLSNTGVISEAWKWVLLSWQMMLVIIGLMQIVGRSYRAGLIFILVGVFFIVPRLGFLFPNEQLITTFASIYWPILLIAIGLIILFSGLTRQKKHAYHGRHELVDTTTFDDGRISYRFVFSGTKNVFLEPEFKGGTIEATCGGVELDLRRTSLPKGTTTLSLNLTLGGAVLYLPSTWNVEVRNQSLLGAFEDHRWRDKDIDYNSKLVIIAKCTLGGGEIK